MERRSNMQQHPHQDSRRGYPLYASTTKVKSSTNDKKQFQSLAKNNDSIINDWSNPSFLHHAPEPNNYFVPFRDDEDSDERTVYFKKSKQLK